MSPQYFLSYGVLPATTLPSSVQELATPPLRLPESTLQRRDRYFRDRVSYVKEGGEQFFRKTPVVCTVMDINVLHNSDMSECNPTSILARLVSLCWLFGQRQSFSTDHQFSGGFGTRGAVGKHHTSEHSARGRKKQRHTRITTRAPWVALLARA